MNEKLYCYLLRFYNQTYHGMTMSAGLRSTGSAFKVDPNLARHMLANVEEIVSVLHEGAQGREFENAWNQARSWLRGSPEMTGASDHGDALYQLNALAYRTWTRLCDNPLAKHYAQEQYTDIIHPDNHPGAGAIKQIWVHPSAGDVASKKATLWNLGDLFKDQ